MIVKMNILRLLGSSDDKEKICVARPEGPPYGGSAEETVKKSKSKRSKQRQFTITGWTDDSEIVLTGATDSEKAKSAEYTG